MANNRMWLVNRRTGEKVLLAKYYPSDGWYAFELQEKDLKKRLDGLFEAGGLDVPRTAWGGNDYAIEYEVTDGPAEVSSLPPPAAA